MIKWVKKKGKCSKIKSFLGAEKIRIVVQSTINKSNIKIIIVFSLIVCTPRSNQSLSQESKKRQVLFIMAIENVGLGQPSPGGHYSPKQWMNYLTIHLKFIHCLVGGFFQDDRRTPLLMVSFLFSQQLNSSSSPSSPSNSPLVTHNPLRNSTPSPSNTPLLTHALLPATHLSLLILFSSLISSLLFSLSSNFLRASMDRTSTPWYRRRSRS